MGARILKASERTWRETVALVKTFPCTYPIRVRRCRTPADSWGDCTLKRGKGPTYFLVRVSSKLQEPARTLVLAHEVAHALGWHPDHPRADHHGPHWGVAMSEVWQALVEM